MYAIKTLAVWADGIEAVAAVSAAFVGAPGCFGSSSLQLIVSTGDGVPREVDCAAGLRHGLKPARRGAILKALDLNWFCLVSGFHQTVEQG